MKRTTIPVNVMDLTNPLRARTLSATPKAPAYIWDVEVEFIDKEPRLEGGMMLSRVAMGKM